MAKKVFSISEESSAGGSSYCWVEHRDDGYFLIGNELGEMAGPCASVPDALEASGFQFAMEFVDIETSISAEQLREALEGPAFIVDNFAALSINGEEADPVTVDSILRAYAPAG